MFVTSPASCTMVHGRWLCAALMLKPSEPQPQRSVAHPIGSGPVSLRHLPSTWPALTTGPAQQMSPLQQLQSPRGTLCAADALRCWPSKQSCPRAWHLAAGALHWHQPKCSILAFAQLAKHAFLYVFPSSAHTSLPCRLHLGHHLLTVSGPAAAGVTPLCGSALATCAS